jgi:21S rRNA (GM2251-2'-O)-methyltransferase
MTNRSERKVRSSTGRNAPDRERNTNGFGRKTFGNDTGIGRGENSPGKSFSRGTTTPFKSNDRRSLGKPTTRPPRDSDRSSYPRRNSDDYAQGGGGGLRYGSNSHEVSESTEQKGTGRESYPSLSSKKPYSPSSRTSYGKEIGSTQTPTRYDSQRQDLRSDKFGGSSKQYESQERSFKSEERKPQFNAKQTSRDGTRDFRQHGPQEGSFRPEARSLRPDPAHSNRDVSSSHSRTDTRLPVSIPYTTPASEFLYGTSVVEAALNSRRVPRRKHYKLYIYNGDNREAVQRDAGLERLAKKNGVDVVRVSGDWLRILDKMSGGRPHNGYILEASPLPRQPIISLGELTTKDGKTGFQVTLDHQSREEAAVNGTDDFIKDSSNIQGRKPFVLLLDSIVDPGNLGGIIRTASFLGVTAIAVSTRNSASFTSVVLKASAGASENVTIFSVHKPAGFLVDSKAAGWKVYAAVAPSGRQDPDVPETLTTDQLNDPLNEYPCILMLGGEGEGLRWNLRSKADVDLSIRGSGRSHNVDSLNVSVAAGILCSSFLGRNKAKDLSDPIEVAKVDDNRPAVGDLF